MGDIDDQEIDTLSLTDFPITQDGVLASEDDHHRSPPSSAAADDIFEFFHGGYFEEHMMSDADDIIFRGKLLPINHRPNCEFRRSESPPELKTGNTGRARAGGRLVRTGNSSLSSEPAPETHRDSLGKKLSSSSSSPSRRCVLTFGVVKVPPEMDLRDIKNRQVRRKASASMFPAVEGGDMVSVCRGGDDRKSSWGVLRFLSCQSPTSVAETASLRWMPKVKV